MSRSLSLVGSVCLLAALVTLTIAQDAKAPAKAKGRLPAHYGDVVTEAQRGQIYTIQGKYNDQIKKLQEEIKALADKRDAEIEGLLTAEQKTKLESLRAEASKKKAEGKAATDAKPATEPAAETAKTPAKTATTPAPKSK